MTPRLIQRSAVEHLVEVALALARLPEHVAKEAFCLDLGISTGYWDTALDSTLSILTYPDLVVASLPTDVEAISVEHSPKLIEARRQRRSC